MDVQATIARMQAHNYGDLASPMTFKSPINRASVSLQAIDRSSVTLLKEKSLEVSAVKPCCTVLSADLAALRIPPAQMVDVNVAFGGVNYRILSVHDKPDPSWRVMNDQLKPVPGWRTEGEILFVLMVI
jgi:hypothetical protein